MFSRRFALKCATVASLSTLTSHLPVGAQDSFVASMQITDVGAPDGASDIQPMAMNANGDVLVNALVDDSPTTFVFRGGAFEPIGGDDNATWGSSINDTGTVAGAASSDDGPEKGALLNDESVVIMPGDYSSGRARAVTLEGVVAGEAFIEEGDSETRPVYWTESSIEPLPAIGGDGAGSVFDLNTIQQMVGWSDAGGDSLARHATLWDNGVATDLGTLGGNYSEARAINETGLIVGGSMTREDQNALEESGTSPFSWQDGVITDLGLGPDHAWGIANDVNDVGMIVGLVGLPEPGDAGNDTVAILWTNGEVLDLNTITSGGDGLTLVDAVSVNAFGQILCRAIDADGNTHIATLSVIGN
ncbi:MAG: hypothetical protein KF883_10360 [Thermomicrobiales bacterium]|nr:hypothetical protein [Thermomicrobiales bacterium]